MRIPVLYVHTYVCGTPWSARSWLVHICSQFLCGQLPTLPCFLFCAIHIHTYVVWVQCVCSRDLVHCFITCICHTVLCEWLYEPSSPLRYQFNNLLTGKYSVSASHPTWDVAKVRMYVLTYILTYICMCMYVWIDSSEELLLLSHWIAKCNSSKTSP